MSRVMSVAYFSPLAPLPGQVSEYSEELLPHLCRRVNVDVYTDDRVAATQEVGRVYPVYGYRDFAGRKGRYDHLIFQIANSPECVPIYDLFRRFGGVAVLHDLDLSQIIGAASKGNGCDSLGETRRRAGLCSILRAMAGALLRQPWPRLEEPEMHRVVAERAEGLVVHSSSAREYLLAQYPRARVRQIPLGIPRAPLIDMAEARQALSLPIQAFICLSPGPLNREARLDISLQAFARLLDRCPNSLYVLLGEAMADYPLEGMAQSLGIADRIRLAGRVDRATLYRYLAASDAGISLRHSVQAEACAGLLRLMSAGRPVILSECGFHAQLPNDCTLKIKPGPGEVAHTVAALWALCGHPPMRHWYGQRAAQFAQTEHALAATARQYIQMLEELETVGVAEEVLLRENVLRTLEPARARLYDSQTQG